MKRVLLVDDDPVITRIYQVGLSPRGFGVWIRQEPDFISNANTTGTDLRNLFEAVH